MNLKRILAVVLAVAAVGAVTVTALAASDSSASESRTARAAWSEKNLDPFKKLLDDGVVSQATCDKMKAYIEENTPQKVERPERKAERVNILDTLLEAKIIIQAEYDAMNAAMPTPGKPNVQRPALGEKPTLPNKSQHVNFFDKFVEDGIISEDTASAIQEYLQSQMPDKPEIKGHAGERVDIFSKMLEAGIITQNEYDAVKASMPERPAIINRRDWTANDNQ